MTDPIFTGLTRRAVMTIDDLHDIPDTSRATIEALADRIAASHTEERLVYRETELDELWRLLAAARADSAGAVADRLARAMDVVMQAHDLVGISAEPAAAAATLRAVSID